jgi:lipoprotein-anchoring transpeptidase ErfK/SrfK
VLARLPQFSYLQVQSYSGDWAYVYNPRARGSAYMPSRLLGPSDAPPSWVTAPPPPSIGSVEQVGRTIGGAAVAFYPVADKFAYVARLNHNERIVVHDRVRGVDGKTWYRVDNGYLAEDSVRLPTQPTRTYSGRWIDADLKEPAMLVAYDGDTPIMSTLVIKGRIASETPTGVFEIQRRVEDETMDSSTLGIPNDSPEGYKLEHVLFTQYFTADGASIHYNYWSSNFGYSGSHGCLGVDRAASEFLWGWADYGTPVVIHS